MKRHARTFYLGTFLLVAAAISTAADKPRSTYTEMSLTRRQDMQREVRVILGLLEGYHYRSRAFVELDAPALLEAYLAHLDPRRILFLESDAQFVHRRFDRNLKSSYLLSGDIYPAFEIFDTFRERFRARQAWVRARLEKPFVLDGDGVFSFDRDSARYPTDAKSADEIWERMLVAELIGEMLHDSDRDRAIARVKRHYEESGRTIATLGAETIEEIFLNSLLLLQDPHSGYDSASTLLDRDVEMQGSLVGIGVELKMTSGRVMVESLAPGGAAELSGQVRPGDVIVAISDEGAVETGVAGLGLNDVVKRLRGEAGTRVVVTLQGSDESARRRVTLQRDRIRVGAGRASARIYDVPGASGIVRVGLVHLPVFYGEAKDGAEAASAGAGADVKELLGKLRADGAEAVVLDLRDNPGGLSNEAVRVAGAFIDRGPVYLARAGDGRSEVLADDEAGVSFDGPLVVLTSPQSASASEIVGGALRAYGRAIVVGGEHTFGKGTAQLVVPLKELAERMPGADGARWGALRLTGKKFFLPDGSSTQLKGVPSDLVLAPISRGDPTTEMDLPGALPWNAIPAPEFFAARSAAMNGLRPVSLEIVAQMRKRFEARQSALPEFDWYRRALAYAMEVGARSQTSLNFERRLAERRSAGERRLALRREKLQLHRETAFAFRAVDLEAVAAQNQAHRAQLEKTPPADGGSRVDRVMDGVFYFQSASDAPLGEVRVSALDLGFLIDDASELAAEYSRAAGVEIDGEKLARAFAEIENADAAERVSFEVRLAKLLGVASDDAAFARGLTAIIKRVVELDPSLAGRPSLLDVPLREGLRLAADWRTLGGDVSGTQR